MRRTVAAIKESHQGATRRSAAAKKEKSKEKTNIDVSSSSSGDVKPKRRSITGGAVAASSPSSGDVKPMRRSITGAAVIKEKSSPPVHQGILRRSFAAIQEKSNSDVSSVSSGDVKQMLNNWSTCYGQSKGSENARENVSPDSSLASDQQSVSENKSSWCFDLGPLDKQQQQQQQQGREPSRGAVQRVTKTKDTLLAEDESNSDSNSVGLFSEMEEAIIAMQTITRRTFEQSQSTAMETSKSSFENSVVSNDETIDDLRSDSVASSLENNFGSDIYEKSTKTECDLLQERRAARASRMEKVRQRIAREKEEAQAKKEEEKRKAREADMSEHARRKRAYEWYCRFGMPPKKDMKKRVKAMGNTAHVTAADCDLLPWNFRGTALNTCKLAKLGIK